MILTLVHKVTIINSSGEAFVITNIGNDANNDMGITGIDITRNKSDLSELCNIHINSRFDVNGVIKLDDGSNDLKLTNQLPLNNNDTLVTNRYRGRFKQFNYEIGDIVIVEMSYNENTDNTRYESFFGFIKTISNTENKNSHLIIENHCYHIRKFLFNFSERTINVKDLMYKVIDKYNSSVQTIYKSHLAGLSDSSLKSKILSYLMIEKLDALINVDYDIKNYRSMNTTGMDIFNFLDQNYFTKSNFFQVPGLTGGKTYYIGGLFNLFNITEVTNLPSLLSNMFQKDFIYKNYDLWYETTGLDDNYIIDSIRKEGSTITDPIIKLVTEKSLAWQDARDVIVRINFKLIDKDNNLIEKSWGDDGGETKDVILFQPLTDKQMEKFKDQWLNDIKFTGYKRGSTLVSYGVPNITLFDPIYIIDVYQNQKEGTQPYNLVIQKYLPQGVATTYTNGGYRQSVTLGPLLSTNIKIDNGYNNNSIYKADAQRFIKSTTSVISDQNSKVTVDVSNMSDIILVRNINATGKRINDNTLKFIPLRNNGQKDGVALNFYGFKTLITDPTNLVTQPTITFPSNFERKAAVIKPITDLMTLTKTNTSQAADIRIAIAQDKRNIDSMYAEHTKRKLPFESLNENAIRIIQTPYTSFILLYKLSYAS